VALHEAALLGDSVRVLHSWRTTPYFGTVPGFGYDVLPSYETGGEAATTFLEERVTDALKEAAEPGVEVVSEVRPGDAGTCLTQASALADLLVLGTRTHGAIASAMVGSATNYVLHHAQCPVLIVPAHTGPVLPWARVVVGFDGSDCARSALRWGAARATSHRCPLVVVHAWQFVTSPGWSAATSLPPHDDYVAQVQSWLRNEVDESVPDLTGVDVQVLAVQDYAASSLVATAGPDDLLVVGSRGRSGFHDLLVGSVALQCTHHARGAMAVLRAGAGPTP